MQVFYAPGITGSTYLLDEKESRHCIRVLRMKKGSPVKMVDGSGNLFEGYISKSDPGGCQIDIENVIYDFEKRPYRLHIAISPLKNPERFEWFVEKSVEIGIDEITPLLCRNTEKTRIKAERLNSIIIAAMKQSLKAQITLLNDPVEFSAFVRKKHQGSKMIAHCSQAVARTGIEKAIYKGAETVILIGPEGDFSEEEIRAASIAGFESVHLGSSRLRTETAGVAACHSVYLLNR